MWLEILKEAGCSTVAPFFQDRMRKWECLKFDG
jgi:hypothetical protein